MTNSEPITGHQIQLVQDSAAAVDSILEPFAEAFYANLFRAYPSVRPMFSTEPAVQAGKLAGELRRIVGALTAPERFARQVRTLGERHVRYGAQPAHYEAVGATLLQTFHEQLGEAFTPELHDAWAIAYGTVAALMIEAQANAELEMAG
jgi:hemoglobin-like flavoprotein